MTCSACSGKLTAGRGTESAFMVCRSCSGLHGSCYRGDVGAVVKVGQAMQANASPEDLRYFDLTLVGSEIVRVHGWFDRQTKAVVQYG